MPKYALDTQLFIEAFRDPRANDALVRFHRAFAPSEYLNAVVAHELRCGTRTAGAARALERHVLDPFRRRQRIFAPSVQAWDRAAEVLARLALDEGLDLSAMKGSFRNDVLIAASCREHGIVVVTRNERDFTRIRRHLDFEFVAPWPGAAT